MKKILIKTLMPAAAMAAVLTAGNIAKCQPYYTNTSQGAGAQQYNNNYPQPLQPGKTLAQQYQAGILAGAIAPAPWYLLTNSFSTNIYTTPPVITANAAGAASQAACATNVVAVFSVTLTNFVLQTAVSNQTVYWQAIGH